MEAKSYYNPDSLYNQCIMCYVKHLKPKVRQLDEIDGLQTLPPNILADIYLAVSFACDSIYDFISLAFVCFFYFVLFCSIVNVD